MATTSVVQVVQRIRQSLLQGGAGLTDGHLLGQFVDNREDSAFAALVRRHGPMVLGVCRRVLGDLHDAEDAFQATFLVLVRKARSITVREKLAGWLYGVAYHTALKARAMSRKRRARERQVPEVPEREVEPEELWSDLQPLLDHELARLPEKYRLPIVLCDLEGKPRKEVANRLGWPEGTLSGRLSRGRRILANRLTQRGVVLSGGALATLLSEQAAVAVPTSMASSTIQAASLFAAGQAMAKGAISVKVASLTEGVLKMMLFTKLKTIMVLTLVVVLACGAILLSDWSASAQDARSVPQSKDGNNDSPSPATHNSLRGIWAWVGIDTDEMSAMFEKRSVRLVVTNDFWILEEPRKDRAFTYKADVTESPNHLDLTVQNVKGQGGKVVRCIYEIDGDTLKVCESSGARPTKFKGGPGMTLYTFKRVSGLQAGANSFRLEPIPGTQLQRFGAAVTETPTGKLMFGADKDDAAPPKRKPANADPAVIEVNERRIKIPINIDSSRRNEMTQLHLFASQDEGKTWQQIDMVQPNADNFSFHAPKDGLFWLSIQAANRDGRKEPSDFHGPAQADLKILVKTGQAGQGHSR